MKQIQRNIEHIMAGGGKPWQRAALAALSKPYAAAMRLRNRAYDRHLKKSYPLGRPTISVGNLTTGGTGKTPMVCLIAERLLAMNTCPAILLRGYRGDEQRIYTDLFNDCVPVEPNPDRVRAAARVLSQHRQTTTFILDDAFQHRRVRRDIDLVLLDATEPFGYDHVLPRGLLREPETGLTRAHAVIITHADLVAPEALADLDREVERLTKHPPLAHAVHAWTAFRDARNNIHDINHLRAKRAHGICGIGNPEAFFQTLVKHVAEPAYFTAKPDHHAYTADELQHLLAAARDENIQALVTTDKDWVKWRSLLPPTPPSTPPTSPPTHTSTHTSPTTSSASSPQPAYPPIYRPVLAMTIPDPAEDAALTDLLKTLL